MTILGADGKPIGGCKLRVMNGPLAGHVFTERLPEGRYAKIEKTDSEGTTLYLMFEKTTGGLCWRGWSKDGVNVDAPWKSPRARQITNGILQWCRANNVDFVTWCCQSPKPKPLTPADLGPYSHDDIYGEDEIKNWEPPSDDDDEV